MLNQLEFYGYHGLFPEEKKLGQRFIIDAELFLPLHIAGKTDDMNDSADYGAVYKLIKDIVEGESKDLIEALAEDIAQQILANFKLVKACGIKVIKPDPPICGNYKSVAVEIYREREQ